MGEGAGEGSVEDRVKSVEDRVKSVEDLCDSIQLHVQTEVGRLCPTARVVVVVLDEVGDQVLSRVGYPDSVDHWWLLLAQAVIADHVGDTVDELLAERSGDE